MDLNDSRLGLSSCCFPGRSFLGAIASCREMGVEILELSATDDFDLASLPDPALPPRLLAHNYFSKVHGDPILNLAAPPGLSRDTSMAYYKLAIDLSASLHAPFYSVHAGFGLDMPSDWLGRPEIQAKVPVDNLPDPDEIFAALLTNTLDLAAYAFSQGIRLLVENHVVSPANGPTGTRLLPMTRAEELLNLLEAVNNPALGLLVDVGHLKVSAETLGFDPHLFLDLVAPHTVALHLSDNDGQRDSHSSFGSDAWFLPRLRDFSEAAVIVEIVPDNPSTLLAVRDLVAVNL